MIKKVLLSSFILVLISSCAQNYENQKLTKTEKLKLQDLQSCEYYGFKKNTLEFSNCIMNLDLNRKRAELKAKQLECQNVRRSNSTSGVTGFWGGVLMGMRENLACN